MECNAYGYASQATNATLCTVQAPFAGLHQMVKKFIKTHQRLQELRVGFPSDHHLERAKTIEMRLEGLRVVQGAAFQHTLCRRPLEVIILTS